MQLSAGLAPAPEDVWIGAQPEQTEPRSAAMIEYDARRCHVCHANRPPFGFGPPLTAAGRQVWACVEHRETVNLMLTEVRRPTDEHQQSTLL
jgi:hypothetical protein